MTTSAGSIRLDLLINGPSLPAEVLREIKTALEPTLVALRREMNTLQRDYDKLGRDALRSGEKQVASAKATAAAVAEVGDAYRQMARLATKCADEQVSANQRVSASLGGISNAYLAVAATAVASSAAQVSALHDVTNEIDQQTAAWGRLADALKIASTAPTPRAPSPQGIGGSDVGSGPGSRRAGSGVGDGSGSHLAGGVSGRGGGTGGVGVPGYDSVSGGPEQGQKRDGRLLPPDYNPPTIAELLGKAFDTVKDYADKGSLFGKWGRVGGAVVGLGRATYDAAFFGDAQQRETERWLKAMQDSRTYDPEPILHTFLKNMLPPNFVLPQPPSDNDLRLPGLSDSAVGVPSLTQQSQAAEEAVKKLINQVEALRGGHFEITSQAPELLQIVEQLDWNVQHLANGTVVIDADTDGAFGAFRAVEAQTAVINSGIANMDTLQEQIDKLYPPSSLRPSTPWYGAAGLAGGFGRADGGVLPGYSPGVDNMLVPMSGGEGVLIPEAVRGLGGAGAIYAINSMFRPGLSRRGYRDGGVVGAFDDGILPPGMSPLAADATVGALSAMGTIIALLTEIRDLLRAVIPAPQVPGAGVGANALNAPGLEAGQNFVGELTQNLPGSLPISDVINALGGVGSRPLPTRTVDTFDLLKEGNPMALGALLGYAVGDYSRAGGQGSGVITSNAGPDFNASGQLYSDTAALVDRSFTSLDASMKAGFDQLMDVMSQVRDELVKIASNVVATGADTAIALAGGSAPEAAPPAPKALGGSITGGVPGHDSVPILAMPGEHMLTVADVNAMGGQGGVYAFRRALHSGGLRGFAAGGAINANSTVGADFYGVSQLPIIGVIVSMLNSVLLQLIGVQIQARDTMDEMSGEFRQFRGDFQAYNAEGSLFNDTSGLTDRSGTSIEEAADERVRILKIVIKELIEYIIQNVLVPIGKAVGKAAVAAGASAAQTAINTQAQGAGNIVGSLITSAGNAGIDIGAQLLGDLGVGLTDVLTEGIAAMLQSTMPGLVQSIFGQGLSGLFPTGPTMAPAMGGGIAAALAALLGTAAVFDDGGLAVGTGLMPKATIAPERVLSPQQTESFDRLVAAITNSTAGVPAGNRTIHAPIAVYGSESAAHEIRDLLEKIDV